MSCRIFVRWWRGHLTQCEDSGNHLSIISGHGLRRTLRTLCTRTWDVQKGRLQKKLAGQRPKQLCSLLLLGMYFQTLIYLVCNENLELCFCMPFNQCDIHLFWNHFSYLTHPSHYSLRSTHVEPHLLTIIQSCMSITNWYMLNVLNFFFLYLLGK